MPGPRSPSEDREYRPVGEVRTFALRRTRMTDAQRRALEELGPAYIVEPPEPPSVTRIASGATSAGWPRNAFPNPGLPLIVEFGFGMGEATAAFASSQKRFNLLGVEVHRPGVGKLLLDIEKRGLDNLRIVTVDGVTLLRDYLGDESLDGVHIFFPDPWPKKRHHKRRLIQPEFLKLLAHRVAPGGYLYVVTDWQDYADQMREALEVAFCRSAGGPSVDGDGGAPAPAAMPSGPQPVFVNPYPGFAPPRPWRPTTAFERKARKKGHDILELFLLRSGSAIV
ncbi:MAG: tRNA (guanosine(46)-N7)-methyltransferase TrmB [Spirochaetota bacterium]